MCIYILYMEYIIYIHMDYMAYSQVWIVTVVTTSVAHCIQPDLWHKDMTASRWTRQPEHAPRSKNLRKTRKEGVGARLDCEVGETVYSWELIKIEKSVVAKVLLRSWMIMQYFGMVIPPLIGTYHGQHNVFQ